MLLEHSMIGETVTEKVTFELNPRAGGRTVMF